MSRSPSLIGIRREDKNRWERRVPLTPEHVRSLVAAGIAVRVQPSEIRAFPDVAYAAAGAEVAEDLEPCPVVLAIKEIPIEQLRPGRTYAFFSHTIKGQPHNMPLLRRVLEERCTLIDYERVVDARGRRLVFFGRHAGLAGAVETLRALGKRLAAEGIDTPFADVRSAYEYAGVPAALQAVAEVGAAIVRQGLPRRLRPLVIGIAGYGNVASGVRDMFAPLDPKPVEPHELSGLDGSEAGVVYQVVFEEQHLVKPRDPARIFELQDYYDHPERYAAQLARHLPDLTVLVNAIYWAPRYPRLVTCEALRELYATTSAGSSPRLRVIGDITCDIEGAIECTVRATEPDQPSYVWDVSSAEIHDGVQGNGPVVMAVDNLPCEFPVEASSDFGDALVPFIAAVARADYSAGLDNARLPEEIARAVIAVGGTLAPDYAYLADGVAKTEGT